MEPRSLKIVLETPRFDSASALMVDAETSCTSIRRTPKAMSTAVTRMMTRPALRLDTFGDTVVLPLGLCSWWIYLVEGERNSVTDGTSGAAAGCAETPSGAGAGAAG
ncbi:hypothetical protein ACFPRL_02805 [Pseudoclavibacter helvolus]